MTIIIAEGLMFLIVVIRKTCKIECKYKVLSRSVSLNGVMGFPYEKNPFYIYQYNFYSPFSIRLVRNHKSEDPNNLQI